MNRWLLVSIVLTVLAAAASAVVYGNREAWLPEQIPTHWGAGGKPDAWTTRDGVWVHLALLPATMAGMLLLFAALPWLSPKQFSIEPFRSTYDYISALVIFLFGYMHAVLLATQLQSGIDLVTWLVGGMLLILAALGNVLGKVKRNFYVGVKTPWTLASDTVWNRTHRLAAWLMAASGVGGFVLVVLGVTPLVPLGLFIAAALFPVFYSLWLYKRLEREGRLEKPEAPAN
jgi:uncharacterized membrane protein